MEDESVEDETVEDELVEDETVEDETVEDETVKSFRQALRARMWRDARDELRRRDFPSSLVDEIITAWEQPGDPYTFYYAANELPELLLHCNTEKLDRVLARATREG
jgi:hypothetical protein